MPIPSLPLDIVVEIVSHLEEEEEDNLKQIEHGKTTSLVCRSWRPSVKVYAGGRSISARPRSILCKPTSKLSLISHYSSQWAESLPTLLSQTAQLKSLRLLGHSGTRALSVLRVASSLAHLTNLNLQIDGGIHWTAEMQAGWRTGFTSVKVLMLAFRAIYLEDPFSEPLQTTIPISHKPIRRACLFWHCPLVSEPVIARLFLSALDPSILTYCRLGDQAACPWTLKWLADCENLKELNIGASLGRVNKIFSDLVQYLPDMRQLDYLEVKAHLPDGKAPPPISVPISLGTVLAALPSKLTVANFEQFVFFEVEAVPCFNTHEMDGDPIVDTLYQIGEETRPIILWKDSRGNWYREIDDRLEKEESDEERGELGNDDSDQL
ncbi:hypothetical protein JCM3765_004358 [Sporobolomyces pararoseus]